ncbi:MAG: amino acid permease, partial [Chlamydiia bacterium]|nr:amino acid permease [Chlamydiia bacterium]
MSSSSAKKDSFGMLQGVLIPNITMMFGVILFLRVGVITASAGLGQMLAAIALSLVIMILTSFSIGALATNMRVGDGGVYFIISRTLGVEIGGAIGMAIFFAQLITIALTLSGFGLSFCELFPQFSITAVE